MSPCVRWRSPIIIVSKVGMPISSLSSRAWASWTWMDVRVFFCTRRSMQCVRPISTRAIRYHGASGHDHLAQLPLYHWTRSATRATRVACAAVLKCFPLLYSKIKKTHTKRSPVQLSCRCQKAWLKSPQKRAVLSASAAKTNPSLRLMYAPLASGSAGSSVPTQPCKKTSIIWEGRLVHMSWATHGNDST